MKKLYAKKILKLQIRCMFLFENIVNNRSNQSCFKTSERSEDSYIGLGDCSDHLTNGEELVFGCFFHAKSGSTNNL